MEADLVDHPRKIDQLVMGYVGAAGKGCAHFYIDQIYRVSNFSPDEKLPKRNKPAAIQMQESATLNEGQ